MSEQTRAEPKSRAVKQPTDVATGPCVGCGELNHTAHNVSICAVCARNMRGKEPARNLEFERQDRESEAAGGASSSAAGKTGGASPTPRKSEGIDLSLTHFEASMVLCVIAVAKYGPSAYDTPETPIRRAALERSYQKLSQALGVEDVHGKEK